MHISPAQYGDIDQLVRLLNNAYRTSGGWTNETEILSGQRADADMLRDIIEHGYKVMLVARLKEDSSIVGCIAVEPMDDGETCELGSLSIDTGRQNEGLGRQLLAAGERHIVEQGGCRARLTVISVREPLIAWYERRGYERTGETEAFPYDNPRVGNPLVEGLTFAVLVKKL